MQNQQQRVRQRIVIAPHLQARDDVDLKVGWRYAALFLPVFALAMLALIAVLGWVGYLLRGFDGTFLGLLGPLLMLYWMRKVSVLRLELDEHGVHIKRLLSSTETIAWDQIESVQSVTRKELVEEGWLCWPPKEQTFSMTAQGHYRIRHKNGVFYYPPADPQAFEAAVAQFRNVRPHTEAEVLWRKLPQESVAPREPRAESTEKSPTERWWKG